MKYTLKDLLKDLEGFDLSAEVKIEGDEIVIFNPTEIDGAHIWYIGEPSNCPYDDDYKNT